MTVSQTISSAPMEHPAMDYAFLRREGMRHLERLAGHLWTDFNTHDPGVTILEQLCYALTDLGRRINYTIPDLLAGSEGDGYESLYSPAQVLSSQAVTQNDLRKLAVDVNGVRNAWVEEVAEQAVPLYYDALSGALNLRGDPLEDDPVYLKGLCRVLIELEKEPAEPRIVVLKRVKDRLHAHRGLCQDFAAVQALSPVEIQVEARIEIEAVEDVQALMLEIYRRMGDYISPPVRFYSLSQLLAAGKRVDEIFQGPLLGQGFIDDDDLQNAERRTELHTSDLIRVIMDVPGVRAVRTISIAADEGAPAPWELGREQLDPDPIGTPRAPRLDRQGSSLILERNGLPVAGSETIKWERVSKTAVAKSTVLNNDLAPPQGRDRQVGNYYSLQHQFPANYGIGVMGLPDSAIAQRQAQARQLKAYLLFFDQILANYFAQLAHVGDLFSFSADGAGTYFCQPVDDPSLGLEDIRRTDMTAHRERLQQINQHPRDPDEEAEDYGRRNRFLNHLLARFAEQFNDYALVLYGTLQRMQTETEIAQKLVQDKASFLEDYPQISSGRGTGMNSLEPWNANNRSGLENRLRRKIGIVDAEEDFYLVEHILLRPEIDDKTQLLPFIVESRSRDPFSLQLSFVFPDGVGRYGDSDFKAFVERMVRWETPAHLFPTIHWLDAGAMAAFTTAYQDWLAKRRTYLLEN